MTTDIATWMPRLTTTNVTYQAGAREELPSMDNEINILNEEDTAELILEVEDVISAIQYGTMDGEYFEF